MSTKANFFTFVLASLAFAGCGQAPDDAGILCGADAVSRAESGPRGPRRVVVVLEETMTPEQRAAWIAAVDDWRAAVEASCPFVPTYVDGATSSDLTYDGTTSNAAPRDVIELRVDDPQPDDMSGNGWSWLPCRSGRATISARARDVRRTTRHELGHALGHLSHDNSGELTLMATTAPDWWKVADVEPADVENYARIWCPAARPAASPE